MIKKALITEEFHQRLTDGLENLGYSCDQLWEVTTESIQECIAKYEILVINSKINVNKQLIDHAKCLKCIIRVGSGLEIIDQSYCSEKGIQIISTPEGNANAVAEHVLGFILSAYNNLNKAQTEMLEGIWSRESNRGEELCGKTIAIIGCGNNGSRLAKLMNGFDTEVLVYDHIDVGTSIAQTSAKQVGMEEIYFKADLVSVHLPLNSDTHHFINNSFLKNFNKSIDLVNTSRGGICVLEDVWTGLEEGTIRRAMLDVYDNEPFKMDERVKSLLKTNKLFVTPHIAGWTYESKKKMAEQAIIKLNQLDFC
jgi:D-3-phosphoglycerate dehydrogenase